MMTTKSLPANIGNTRSLLPSEFVGHGVENNGALSSLIILGNSSSRIDPSDEEKYENSRSLGKDITAASKPPLPVMEDPKKDKNSIVPPDNNAIRVTTENVSNNNYGNVNSSIADSTKSNATFNAIALARANSLSLTSTSLRNANHKAPLPHSFNKTKPSPNISNNNATSQGKFHPESASATAANNSSRNITIDELRKYFHLPIADVAKKLGTCTTALKKICRKLNITKWPYRQILSLTKSIQSLEMASLSDNLEDAIRLQYQEQIALLHKVIGEVLRNPNKTIEHCSLNDLANAVANANGISTITDKSDCNTVQDSETKEDKGSATDDSNETDDKNDSNNNHDTSNDKLSKLEVKALSLSSNSDTIINIEEEVERTIRRATEFLAAPKVKPTLSQNNSNNHTNNNNVSNNASKQTASLSQSKRKYSISFFSVRETKDTPQQLTNAAALSSPANDTNNANASNNGNPNNNNVSAQEGRSNSASPASSASSHKTQDVSPSQKDTSHPTPHNANKINSSNIQYPNLNIGTSIVKMYYFEDKLNQWAFYGPVQLPPLQRKKFKPLSNNILSRRNVPLMEPDVGSNTAIDFVPQTLVNAFKKSIAEQAFANNLMMFDPLTGAFTGRVDPSQATNNITNNINNMNHPTNTSNSNTNSNINMRPSYASQSLNRAFPAMDINRSNINTNDNDNNNTSSFVQSAVHRLHHIVHTHPQHVTVDNTSPPPPPVPSRSSSFVHRDSPLSTVHSNDGKANNNANDNGNCLMYHVSSDMSPEERHHFSHQQHHYPAAFPSSNNVSNNIHQQQNQSQSSPTLHVSYKQLVPVHGLSQSRTGYNRHNTTVENHSSDNHVHDNEEENNDDLHTLTPSVLTDTIQTAINNSENHSHNLHHHGGDRSGRAEEDEDEHGTALALSALLSPLRTPSHHHQHLHEQGYHREPHVFHYADDHMHDHDMIHHHHDHCNNDNYLDDTMDDHTHMDYDMDENRAMKKPRLSCFSAISSDNLSKNSIMGNNHSTKSVVATELNHLHNLSHDLSQQQQKQQQQFDDIDEQEEQEEQQEMIRHWMDCGLDVDEGEEQEEEMREGVTIAELS